MWQQQLQTSVVHDKVGRGKNSACMINNESFIIQFQSFDWSSSREIQLLQIRNVEQNFFPVLNQLSCDFSATFAREIFVDYRREFFFFFFNANSQMTQSRSPVLVRQKRTWRINNIYQSASHYYLWLKITDQVATLRACKGFFKCNPYQIYNKKDKKMSPRAKRNEKDF